jgi:SAM-dependent methyltransferase
MLRSLVDVASRGIAWIRQKRRICLNQGVVRVNLGSALMVAPGWINLDASLNALFAGAPTPLLRLLYRWSGSRRYYTRDQYCSTLRNNRFVHHDFQHDLPFASASIDYIYSSHLLEHLFRDDALRLLREMHRVLKAGGWARICVPDLSHALALFGEGKKEKALEYFFSSSRVGHWNRHQYLYDFELLRDALQEGGFFRVLRRHYRHGEVPDLDVLDNRPEETLYVEAQKAP